MCSCKACFTAYDEFAVATHIRDVIPPIVFDFQSILPPIYSYYRVFM
jgi:hypothetical protein